MCRIIEFRAYFQARIARPFVPAETVHPTIASLSDFLKYKSIEDTNPVPYKDSKPFAVHNAMLVSCTWPQSLC